jgi:predicted kinase
MVGLPCSGKTTEAGKVARQYNALRLTPDVWQLRLFGQDMDDPRHDDRHEAIEEIMWDVARDVLLLGTSVVLDFGFWSRGERDDFRRRARDLGAGFMIHFMDVPLCELLARLEKRNRQAGEEESIAFSPELLEEWAAMFEAPSDDELCP